MAISQIARIKVRQGAEAALPGAPTSLTPLIFSTGLDTGEIAFATDTGRLFIGHSPMSGQPNYNRTTIPYQAVEVLTEHSTHIIAEMMAGVLKNTGGAAYHRAELDPISTWTDVTVDGNPFQIAGQEMIAQIEYFAFDLFSNAPLRQGTLHVISEPGLTQALVYDTSVSSSLAYNAPPPAPPAIAPANTTFSFQFLRGGSVAAPVYRLQYVNNLSQAIVLRFAVKSPTP